jgi:hypothetical protein
MRRSAEHFPKTPLLLSSVAFTASLLGTIRASAGYPRVLSLCSKGILRVKKGYHIYRIHVFGIYVWVHVFFVFRVYWICLSTILSAKEALGIRELMVFIFEGQLISRIVFRTFLIFLTLRCTYIRNKICLNKCILYLEYMYTQTLKWRLLS